MENGTQELDSSVSEQSKASENPFENANSGPLTSGNCEMNYEELYTEALEQKEVCEAQNIEKKLVPAEESSDMIKEREPDPGDIFRSDGAEKREQPLENEEIPSVVENFQMSSKNGVSSLENRGMPPVTASVKHHNKRLEPMQIDEENDPGLLNNEYGQSSEQSRKGKVQQKTPVSGSWVLRSRSQEKPKTPEPTVTLKEGSINEENKRRGRKKKQTTKNIVNEFSRTRNHLRYLLNRIKYEQSLIDAYSTEGWKGQSLDKLKPEKELQRAKSHILRYKLKIRALFQCLDTSLAVGKLPESLFDSKGEIDSEDIFCAKCSSKDVSLDNDIILCDGVCERGFHQFCLEPPLLKEDIPSGDESWLCPGCDCKVDCIDILKDFHGSKVSIGDSWKKIFPEAAVPAEKLDDGSGALSEDSEDDDYDPDKHDTLEKVEGDKSSSEESKYFSASDNMAAAHNNESCLGLPSDDSEDDDFDLSDRDQDKEEKLDSSSSDFTSDSEDLGALLDDATAASEDIGCSILSPSHKQSSTGSKEENPEMEWVKSQSVNDEFSYLMEASGEPVFGKRRVERLDYKKLHDETYGKSSSDSSDEDFDDTPAHEESSSDSDSSDEDFDDTPVPKRRKMNPEKREVTPPSRITRGSKIETKDENQKESKHSTRRTRKNVADSGAEESLAKAGSTSTRTKRSTQRRLGEAATQRLYASFKENQHPERSVKENLAKELGITIQQVSKWFENARWSSRHRPRMESNLTKMPPEPQPTTSTDKTISNWNIEVHESSASPLQNQTTDGKSENLGN